MDGIIATNKTISRDNLASDRAQVGAIGAGGLSGGPLKQRALEVLRRLHARTGDRVVLVAVGGIETADGAWQRITAGAILVQGYIGFIYGGPMWPHHIHSGLTRPSARRGSLRFSRPSAHARHRRPGAAAAIQQSWADDRGQLRHQDSLRQPVKKGPAAAVTLGKRHPR